MSCLTKMVIDGECTVVLKRGEKKINYSFLNFQFMCYVIVLTNNNCV